MKNNKKGRGATAERAHAILIMGFLQLRAWA